jgi:hypothetical protein
MNGGKASIGTDSGWIVPMDLSGDPGWRRDTGGECYYEWRNVSLKRRNSIGTDSTDHSPICPDPVALERVRTRKVSIGTDSEGGLFHGSVGDPAVAGNEHWWRERYMSECEYGRREVAEV